MTFECVRLTVCIIAGALMLTAAADEVRAQQDVRVNELQAEVPEGPLARTVRQATAPLREVQAAVAAGYAVSGGCVSGPEEGTMGVHYVNALLVGDALLNAAQPSADVGSRQYAAIVPGTCDDLFAVERQRV